MKPLFLFVRPPRPLWPFNSVASAFWPPLAFASLAGALRAEVRNVEVAILDAPVLEMGWKTLESEIRRRQPAYLGLGEEAVSCVEGLRLAGLGRAVGATVVAGGCFFSHVAREILETGLVDVVVHGEGEQTVVELVAALEQGGGEALSQVAGISFQHEGVAVTTRPRALIGDLDQLPMPAYDLLPMSRYGARSRNHPDLASIELGRGCVGSCDFCVLWRQMGRWLGDRVSPQLRVKSPERLLEEIRDLAGRHGRRYLGWVDPCYNAHPAVPGAVAEGLLRNGIRIGQSAWVRADGLVRDERAGWLGAMVRSGLNELYVGMERPEPERLRELNKTTSPGDTREAMRLLRRHYPEVCVIGSFIYGLPAETPETVRAIHRYAQELELDQFFFIPLTRLPGTPHWQPQDWDPSGEAFRQFSFLPSAVATDQFGQLERALAMSTLFHWDWTRIRTHLRRLFQADARRRRVAARLFWRGAQFHARAILGRWLGGLNAGGMVFPRWYEQ